MKKNIIIFFLISVCLLSLSAEDKSSNETGFEKYFKSNIGKDITVYITSHDIIFIGTLLEVFDDGILIKTKFKDAIYIRKNAIGYIEINKKVSKENSNTKNKDIIKGN